MLLIQDVIYINTFRMTNKTMVKGSERLGFSNMSEAEFKAYINTNDTYIAGLQPVFLPDYYSIDYYNLDYSTI
jgi:hypothetical protein